MKDIIENECQIIYKLDEIYTGIVVDSIVIENTIQYWVQTDNNDLILLDSKNIYKVN